MKKEMLCQFGELKTGQNDTRPVARGRGQIILIAILHLSLVTSHSAHSEGKMFYVQPKAMKARPADARRVWNSLRAVDWGFQGVGPGDTLVVMGPAVHMESLRIERSGTESNPISIECRPAKSCVIDGESERFAGIDARDAKYVRVSGFSSRSHTVAGIRFEGASSHIDISDNDTSGNKYFGVFVDAMDKRADHIRVTGNSTARNGIDTPVLGGGIYVTAKDGGSVVDIEILDNDASDNIGRYGISIYPKDQGYSKRILIAGNACNRNGSSGIDLSKLVADAVIERNQCRDNGKAMAGSGIHVGGVMGESVSDVVIRNNDTSGQVFTTTDGAGILIDDYTSNIEVSGNRISGNEEAGIKLHRSVKVSLLGNRIEDSDVGLLVDRATDFVAKGNQMLRNRKAGILVESFGGNSLAQDNLIAYSEAGVVVYSSNGPIVFSGNCMGEVGRQTRGGGITDSKVNALELSREEIEQATSQDPSVSYRGRCPLGAGRH